MATGRKRTGKRLLTVGTDCALGKKYTALALARAFRQRGVDADFRATGQTGIMIAGSGMPMDAVVADFLAGAAEILSPGRGSRTLGRDRGPGLAVRIRPMRACRSGSCTAASPTSSCCAMSRAATHLLGYPGFPTPSLADAIALNLKSGALTNPSIRCAGVSFNTSALSAAAADDG